MKLYKDEQGGHQGTAEKGFAEAECVCTLAHNRKDENTCSKGLESPTTPSEPFHSLDGRREASGFPA